MGTLCCSLGGQVPHNDIWAKHGGHRPSTSAFLAAHGPRSAVDAAVESAFEKTFEKIAAHWTVAGFGIDILEAHWTVAGCSIEIVEWCGKWQQCTR